MIIWRGQRGNSTNLVLKRPPLECGQNCVYLYFFFLLFLLFELFDIAETPLPFRFLVGFHGFSRWFHGFWLVFMVFQGGFMVLMVFGWFSMVFQGGFMGFMVFVGFH